MARNINARRDWRSYFFFRFSRLGLNGPLTASSTTSCASRSMPVRFFTLGKANGCPIPHSVLFLFDFPILFRALFAMPPE
jgi:hypothetical protein